MWNALRLRFDDERLERRFRARHGQEVAHAVALVASVGALAVAGFGVVDVLADVPLPLIVFRFAFIVPLLLAATALAMQPALSRWVEVVGAVALGGAATADALFLLWVPPERVAVYQTGLVLFVVGGCACTRVRVRPVMIAALLASTVDVALLLPLPLPLWQRVSLVLYLATANVLGLLVAVAQERSARRRFLVEREMRAAKQRLRNANDRLQELVRRDPLTGLFNRRALDERLDEEVARARRQGAVGALAMLDLDGFKQVNDTLGHAAGDELLALVGATMLRELRREDLAFRLGGDEFCIYFPGLGVRQAQQAMRRLVAVLGEETRSLGSALGFTAGCTDVRGEDLSSDDPLGRADALLYEGKAGGRGRVMIGDERLVGCPQAVPAAAAAAPVAASLRTPSPSTAPGIRAVASPPGCATP